MNTLETPHHRITLRVSLGMLHLDVATALHAPWTVLFGPSGSGKSTLLRFMAGILPGLSRASSATASLHFSRHDQDGQWQTLSEGAYILGPERRDIGYAPQAASLFPHLSVLSNVGFGAALDVSGRALALRRSSPAEDTGSAERLCGEACELFELDPLRRRTPAQLSGGEQQRVSLARAFARPGARLLLLDEPFVGLDRAIRDRILDRLRPALAARRLPVVSVTHDIEEAFLLEADVVRLEAGRLIAQGGAAQILAVEREGVLSALRAH